MLVGVLVGVGVDVGVAVGVGVIVGVAVGSARRRTRRRAGRGDRRSRCGRHCQGEVQKLRCHIIVRRPVQRETVTIEATQVSLRIDIGRVVVHLHEDLADLVDAVDFRRALVVRVLQCRAPLRDAGAGTDRVTRLIDRIGLGHVLKTGQQEQAWLKYHPCNGLARRRARRALREAAGLRGDSLQREREHLVQCSSGRGEVDREPVAVHGHPRRLLHDVPVFVEGVNACVGLLAALRIARAAVVDAENAVGPLISVRIHYAQAEGGIGYRDRQRPDNVAGVGMDDDVRSKAHAADSLAPRRGGHRPLDHLGRDARPSDRDEVNAVGGAVVGGPIQCEAGRIPRREVGFGEQRLAPLDKGERLRGQPAAAVRGLDVVLARRANRPAGDSIGHTEAEHEARTEGFAGLAVRPENDRFGCFTESVSDRLTGGRDRVALREAADGERGECRRRAQKPADGQETQQTGAQEPPVSADAPAPHTRRIADNGRWGLTSGFSTGWCETGDCG